MTEAGDLDPAQIARHGDMDDAAFRVAAHAVVDLMADYLATIEQRPILPPIAPGAVRARLPAAAPEAPEPLARILDDYRALIEPNVTHWQHPSFFAYFPSTASGPGILGEMLMSTLVANAMLWRTSPAATELEEVTVDWLRQALGLPETFDGLYTDTASTSSLAALAAARQAATGDAAAAGLHGARLRIYASAEAHSSIEKAGMVLGLGRAGVRRVDVDAAYAMVPEALTAAIAEDRAAGWLPAAVVATVGTTGSNAVDPVSALAGIAERERLWLHVDAAYAGVVALLPDRRGPFADWERADSIVVNPHKWLFTPLDCSLLLTRRPSLLRDALSLVPEYLRTTDRAAVHDYNEYQPQLGRRFRALKMWFIVRYFGLDGLRARIGEHLELATRFAAWVDAEPDAERLAPVPFATVCFRWHPRGLDDAPILDRLNERLMERLNATGQVFLSHTRLDGRFALRLALGNLRTEPRHVERFWALVRELAPAVAAELRDELRDKPGDDVADGRPEAGDDKGG
ncbi:MAG: pyridoxal phosphate-dependent decarboxylase family protein [Candidatus Limnocylindrales bacterium]